MATKSITQLLLALLCATGLTAFQFDYTISRAKSLWRAKQIGLHYIDHFKLLSTKLKDVVGSVTSTFPLESGKSWSLNFDVVITGDLQNSGDGFLFTLGKTAPRIPKSFLKGENKNKDRFFDFVREMKVQGFWFAFSAQENLIYHALNEGTMPISNFSARTCEVDLTRPLNLYLRYDDGELTLSFHAVGEAKYNTCQRLKVDARIFSEFYIGMTATSSATSSFMIDVKSMVFSSDKENLGISYFQERTDETSRKLFKQISFYKNNEEFLSSRKEAGINKIDVHDIPALYKSQSEVLNILDYTNGLLDRNLETTEEILSYIQTQKNGTDLYSKNLLDSIHSWMDASTKNFEEFERETSNLMTQYDTFDIEGEFSSTKGLVEGLSKKIGGHWEAFQNLRTYGEVIKENIEYLRQKEKSLKKFPDFVKNVLDKDQAGGAGSVGLLLLTMLLGLGLAIIVALCAILRRLEGSHKIRSFAD